MMRKNDLVASPALREEDFRRKIREYQKIPKKILKIQRMNRKLR
jgi:hypothetical protein